MNDLDLCWSFKVVSTIALHLPLNISVTVRQMLGSWFQRTANWKWSMGINGHVTDDVM